MSDKIVQLNEEVIKGEIKELVRGSVEETLNELLEKEAEQLTQAARYERSEARQGYLSGHYDRNLTPTSGDVTLHMLYNNKAFQISTSKATGLLIKTAPGKMKVDTEKSVYFHFLL